MTETIGIEQNSLKKWIVRIMVGIAFIFAFSPQPTSAQEIFSDVNPSNSHYTGILEAYENGFLSGYPDGTFKPAHTLSRANVTKSLGKLVLIKSGVSLANYDFSNAVPFKDVPATHSDNELYKYSIIVKEAGIFTGSNNNLLAMNLMTRQQMAKVLVNAFDLKRVPGQQSKVIDANLAGEEFREYIHILSENNVTTVTNFRPGETTTRAQFATFLTNANNAAEGNQPAPPGQPEIPVRPEPTPVPEPEPEPVVALFAKDLLPITFSEIFSDSYKEGLMPKTIPVVYSDETEKDHSVTWNKSVGNLPVGTHQLVGNVKDTTFTVPLTVNVAKFVLPTFPGLPGDPVIIVPVPPNAPAEYKTANALIVSLPLDVKNAGNALEATQKWTLADNAVGIVKNKYPQYNVSNWDGVLSAQNKLIEKRHLDTSEARSAATVAIHNLYAQIKYVKDPAIAQGQINAAKDKLNAYKMLDKKANTTTMTADINRYQVIVNDLKIVLAAIDEKNMSLLIPNKSADQPGYVLLWPQDNRVESAWFFSKGSEYIDFNKKELLRDSAFFGDNRSFEFTASVYKGSVSAHRVFGLFLEPKRFLGADYIVGGLLMFPPDPLVIQVEL
ncbi:S-layer homology domain-containing protein [Sporosarcina sp. CAU 1771]